MFEKKGSGGKRNEREEENEGKINGYDSEVGIGVCDFSKRVCASNALSRIIHYFCYHVR